MRNEMGVGKDQDKFGCSIETLNMVIDDEFEKYGDHETYILDCLNDAKKFIDKREEETRAQQKINTAIYIIEQHMDW